MTNPNAPTPQTDLNHRSAIEIMKWHEGDSHWVEELPISTVNPTVHFERVFHFGDWTPASHNSGQIWLVLDAMADRGYYIDLEINQSYTEITILSPKKKYQLLESTYKCCVDTNSRNKTILNACLEALEKKEGEPE